MTKVKKRDSSPAILVNKTSRLKIEENIKEKKKLSKLQIKEKRKKEKK